LIEILTISSKKHRWGTSNVFNCVQPDLCKSIYHTLTNGWPAEDLDFATDMIKSELFTNTAKEDILKSHLIYLLARTMTVEQQLNEWLLPALKEAMKKTKNLTVTSADKVALEVLSMHVQLCDSMVTHKAHLPMQLLELIATLRQASSINYAVVHILLKFTRADNLITTNSHKVLVAIFRSYMDTFPYNDILSTEYWNLDIEVNVHNFVIKLIQHARSRDDEHASSNCYASDSEVSQLLIALVKRRSRLIKETMSNQESTTNSVFLCPKTPLFSSEAAKSMLPTIIEYMSAASNSVEFTVQLIDLMSFVGYNHENDQILPALAPIIMPKLLPCVQGINGVGKKYINVLLANETLSLNSYVDQFLKIITDILDDCPMLEAPQQEQQGFDDKEPQAKRRRLVVTATNSKTTPAVKVYYYEAAIRWCSQLLDQEQYSPYHKVAIHSLMYLSRNLTTIPTSNQENIRFIMNQFKFLLKEISRVAMSSHSTTSKMALETLNDVVYTHSKMVTQLQTNIDIPVMEPLIQVYEHLFKKKKFDDINAEWFLWLCSRYFLNLLPQFLAKLIEPISTWKRKQFKCSMIFLSSIISKSDVMNENSFIAAAKHIQLVPKVLQLDNERDDTPVLQGNIIRNLCTTRSYVNELIVPHLNPIIDFALDFGEIGLLMELVRVVPHLFLNSNHIEIICCRLAADFEVDFISDLQQPLHVVPVEFYLRALFVIQHYRPSKLVDPYCYRREVMYFKPKMNHVTGNIYHAAVQRYQQNDNTTVITYSDAAFPLEWCVVMQEQLERFNVQFKHAFAVVCKSTFDKLPASVSEAQVEGVCYFCIDQIHVINGQWDTFSRGADISDKEKKAMKDMHDLKIAKLMASQFSKFVGVHKQTIDTSMKNHSFVTCVVAQAMKLCPILPNEKCWTELFKYYYNSRTWFHSSTKTISNSAAVKSDIVIETLQ